MPARRRAHVVSFATTCLVHYGVLQVASFATPGLRRGYRALAAPVTGLLSSSRKLRRCDCRREHGIAMASAHREGQEEDGGEKCEETTGRQSGDMRPVTIAVAPATTTSPSATSTSTSSPPRQRCPLEEQVRAAVRSLDWPPLVAREWSAAKPGRQRVRDGQGTFGSKSGAANKVHCSNPENAILPDDNAGVDGAGDKRLKVLTWNVLCDGLSGAHPERGGFLKAPEGCLDWDKRRWKILEEILRWDCDVLFLQEVDHHHDWLSPMLATAGYRSFFVKKPCAPGLAYAPGLEDGCSLFYRATAGDNTRGSSAPQDADEVVQERAAATTLDLLDAHAFTFAIEEGDTEGVIGGGAREGTRDSDCRGGEGRVTVQNQVAAIALLRVSGGEVDGQNRHLGEELGQESLVVVATTHLKAAKTELGEIMRARQAQQLLDEVSRFRAGHERARNLPVDSIPIVVAGDFNAAPHASPSSCHSDGGAKDVAHGYEPLCFRRVMSHPLALQSAFPIEEGVFTTWKIRPAGRALPSTGRECDSGGSGTRETKHCIDYVWVSSKVWTAQQSTLPTSEGLGPLRAPSFVYPSDHFALAVELRIPHTQT